MRCLLLVLVVAVFFADTGFAQGDAKLVYADFERVEGGLPVSTRGGAIRLYSYQESPTRASKVTGLHDANPPAPELVRLKADVANRAATFDFELFGPNVFAGAGVEITGRQSDGGKPAADDVTGFKFLELDVYATGVPALRVELVSHGHGIELPIGYPNATFKVRPGLNTYKLRLDSFRQPFWAQRVDPKNVLKNLTSVSITAFCEQCTATKGTVVVDNVVFER